MAFPLLPATLLLIAGGLAALDFFLPPEAEAPAPDTEPIAPPYTPPFPGGQCATLYDITYEVKFFRRDTGALDSVNNGSARVGGPIGGFVITQQNPPATFNYVVNLDAVSVTSGTRPIGITSGGSGIIWDIEANILSISRADGLADDCGDLPNPNSPPPIPSTGLAQSAPPSLAEDTEPLTLGLVPLNLAALLAAAKAALAAAATLAELANAIAEVLDLIAKLLDELKPENRDKNKSTFLYQYGSIEKDGFLRFYGEVSNDGFEAIYLDILFTQIPNGIGKYFGERSPNRYIYNRLGYIAFVSPSLGVMEVRELEFPRQSFSVPKDSIGFFYHLGLNGSIKANASAIYEKEELPVE